MILKIKNENNVAEEGVRDFFIECNKISIGCTHKKFSDGERQFCENPTYYVNIRGTRYSFNDAYLMNNEGKTLEKYTK